MDDIDPRAAKLLGDLLALTLAEGDAEAVSALAAIRRRAARAGVTGGALKQLLERLASIGGPVGLSATDEVLQLRRLVDDQQQELERTRQALQRSQRASDHLTESLGTLHRSRRTGGTIGFLLGLVIAAAGLAAIEAATAPRGVHPGIDRVDRAELADYLHNCYLSSSNSLVGVPYPVHVLIDVDADGRITAAQVAPDQAPASREPQHQTYSDMLIRTLGSGSCGALPMPASLRGRPAHLDLHLPR